MRIFRIYRSAAPLVCLVLMAGIPAYAGSAGDEGLLTTPHVSLKDCVKYSVLNSFEARLARLDLFVAETGLKYSESVFDTFISGNIGYTEDKRQQLSVFSPDDNQTNIYSMGIEKTIPSGTELSMAIGDTRAWNNSQFVSKNPSHSTEVSFDLKQPLGQNILGYVDRKTITITKLSIENSGMEEKDRIEELIADVEKAYWQLVYEKEKLRILNKLLGKAEELHQVDEKNLAIGLIEQVDLLAAEANVANRQAQILTAENGYRRAEEELKLIMNLKEDERMVPSGGLKSGTIDIALEDCLKYAFAGRRDYMMEKKNAEIAGIELRIKENMKWPEIDLSATFAVNGVETGLKESFDKTTGGENTYYYTGLEIKIPLENNKAESEYLKAMYEKEKAVVVLKELERRIITEVGNAYRDVVASEASLVYIKKAVDLHNRKLEEEEKRFKYGRSSTKRLIDFQNELLNAELEEAAYMVEHKKAQVDLYRKMNMTMERYEDIL